MADERTGRNYCLTPPSLKWWSSTGSGMLITRCELVLGVQSAGWRRSTSPESRDRRNTEWAVGRGRDQHYANFLSSANFPPLAAPRFWKRDEKLESLRNKPKKMDRVI